jgi:hypothetical protein
MVVLLEQALGTHEWVRELYGFNVRYLEQLASMLLTFAGRTALSHLANPPPDMTQLRTEVDALLMRHDRISLNSPRATSPVTRMSLLPQQSYGLGYKLPTELQALRFGDLLPRVSVPRSALPPQPPAASLPADQDLRGILTPVRNQLHRGTCVAFATIALLESKILRDTGQSVDLSEQYAYYVARQNDPDRQEDGTYPNYALDGLQQRGVCREELLPYIPFNDWGQAFLFQRPPNPLSRLNSDARRYRIPGYSRLDPHAVDGIRQALRNNQPVCVGVPVFRQAWYNGFGVIYLTHGSRYDTLSAW